MRRDLLTGVVLGATIAAVLTAATVALAGTGVGAVFNLGKTNSVNAQSTLKASTASAAKALQVTNGGTGSGLGITVRAGRSPIVVNSTAGKARNLNADRLDGIDSAQLRFIQLPVTAARLNGGATFSDGLGPWGGILLPDTLDGSRPPSFSCAFVLPPTYTPGTTLTVRLVWHASTDSGAVVLRPNYISVTRPGLTCIAGSGATDGLSAVDGEVLPVPSTATLCSEKLYEIASPDGVTPLQPGDAVVFGLYRGVSSPSDTCIGNLYVSGISVTF